MSLRTAASFITLGLTACAHQDVASPTADAGPAVHGPRSQPFTFDGSASQASTWRWTLLASPPGSALGPADLLDADTPWPTLLPDVEGTYHLELVACGVTSCARASTTARVAPTASLAAALAAPQASPGLGADPLGLEALSPAWGPDDKDPLELRGGWTFGPGAKNQAPVAIATAWTGRIRGSEVLLQAGQSYDPDGDPLQYRWRLLSMPAGSALGQADLVGADGAMASFSPDVAGLWVFRLVVSDGQRRDTAQVTVDSGGTGR